MKKTVLLLLLLISISCGGKEAYLREPSVGEKIPAKAALFIDRETRTGYRYGITSTKTEYEITSGIEQSPKTWGQEVGKLSAGQFERAAGMAFDAVIIIDKLPSFPAGNVEWSYLMVPSIEDMKIEVKMVGTSWMEIIYKLDVYNPEGEVVFAITEKVEESGKLIKPMASSTSVLGIPIAGDVEALPDESQMIFDAVTEGVNTCINKMVEALSD